MSDLLTVAAVQMASGPNIDANLLEAARLLADAASAGARVVVLPENFALMGLQDSDALEFREHDGEGPLQEFLASQASQHGIWLVGGTIPMFGTADDKIRAACLVYDDEGNRAARYDKMHLFDVHLVDQDEQYSESRNIEPGEEVVVVETPCGRLGIAVCYDLRFPEMFRCMLDQGMTLLAVPSAFTAITGNAHWEILVRARAIENLCYVAAAAQGGYHVNGRETWGHSMIVDPWGVVLDELPQGSGVVIAQADKARLESIRTNFPSIHHRRLNVGIDSES